jgi:hypothetical protein
VTIRLQVGTLGAILVFSGRVETAELRPGYMVAVPEKAVSANTRWKDILQGCQVACAVGTPIQSRSL